jgi:hypothetical protein
MVTAVPWFVVALIVLPLKVALLKRTFSPVPCPPVDTMMLAWATENDRPKIVPKSKILRNNIKRSEKFLQK